MSEAAQDGDGDKERFKVGIKDCPRCGFNHVAPALTAVPFENNPDIESDKGNLTHWGECPVTQDPILVYTEYGETS